MLKILEIKNGYIGEFEILGLVKPFSTSTNEGNIPFKIGN